MNVVSFALWGKEPKYTVGALRNAQLARYVYPGWQVRFYVQRGTPHELKDALRSLGAAVFTVNSPATWAGLFWRYLAIADPDVDVAVFRDCDSRLGLREAAAVQEWLTSERTLHVVRDHPAHHHPIMGGLWGLRCARARWIADDVRDVGAAYWQADQEYLGAVVWPRLRSDAVEHDEFFGGRPLPLPRLGDEFLGQVYDEHDMPCERYAASLRTSLRRQVFAVNTR